MNEFRAEPIRVIYFGTPAYAVPALRVLIEDPRVVVPLVVTQPDRPAGRGRKMTPPPVKALAIELDIPVYQPESLRTEVDRAPIAAIDADLFVVAAFGKIFGPKFLALPRLGAVNLHASLLPRYRGASPISAALLEGEQETGVTLMQMDTGLDTGPMLASRALSISPDDTTASLTPRLGQLGAELLIDSFQDLIEGRLNPTMQNDDDASLTRPLVKADGWIDWNQSAVQIERQVRAMWDWPRAWTSLRGEPMQIHRASVLDTDAAEAPGTAALSDNRAVVATGQGQLVIEIAQNAGGKPLPGTSWLQQTLAEGSVLGSEGAPPAPPLPMIRQVRT